MTYACEILLVRECVKVLVVRGRGDLHFILAFPCEVYCLESGFGVGFGCLTS